MPASGSAWVKAARNGAIQRAVLLAVATVVLIAIDQRIWVPFSVSAYAIWNAAALIRTSVRSASRPQVSAGVEHRARPLSGHTPGPAKPPWNPRDVAATHEYSSSAPTCRTP